MDAIFSNLYLQNATPNPIKTHKKLPPSLAHKEQQALYGLIPATAVFQSKFSALKNQK